MNVNNIKNNNKSITNTHEQQIKRKTKVSKKKRKKEKKSQVIQCTITNNINHNTQCLPSLSPEPQYNASEHSLRSKAEWKGGGGRSCYTDVTAQ